MKYAIWSLGAILMIIAASCSNPTANQATVEASDQYSSSANTCPVVVNLDGSNTITLTGGQVDTFPLVSAGAHTLNFSTSGSCAGPCVFTNSNVTNGGKSYSTTFNAVAGNVYVGTVILATSGGSCGALLEQGP